MKADVTLVREGHIGLFGGDDHPALALGHNFGVRRVHLPLVALLLVALIGALAGCGGASRPIPAIRTTAGEVRPLVYVALGDSYTGAPRVGQPIDSACNRTNANYPHLFAHDRRSSAELVTLIDVSCGGARTRHLSTRQKPLVERQLAAVRSDAGLVSVAIGGNDVGIMALVETCLTKPSACERRRAAVVAGVRRMRVDLVAALRRVQTRAPHAQIVVVGYPEIVPSKARCLKAGRATLAKARDGLNRIAIAQRNAARQVGATFLDPRIVTRGHGLCTADPWIARRTTATSQKFHPTAAEQRAVARSLDQLLQTQAIASRVTLSAPGSNPH